MQNDKTCSEIVNSLARTRAEANLLVAEVETLERSLYKIGEADFDHTLETGVRAKTAYAIGQAVKGGNHSALLIELKAKINSLTYLGLRIAFEPNLEAVGKFYTWVRQNIGEGVALDIVIDKTVLGGAVIEYKGKIKNFSVLTLVNQYFTN
jgi:hypothetical protein